MNGDFEQWLRDSIVEQGKTLAEIKATTSATAETVREHTISISDLKAQTDRFSGFITGVKWIGAAIWAGILSIGGLLLDHMRRH